MRNIAVKLAIGCWALAWSGVGLASSPMAQVGRVPPAPAAATCVDLPWDDGTAIEVSWTTATDAWGSGFHIYRVLSADERAAAQRDARVAAASSAWAAAMKDAPAEGDLRAQAEAAARAAAVRAAEEAGTAPAPTEVLVGTVLADEHRFVVSPVEPGTTHAFRVRAFDFNGHESDAIDAGSATATVEWFLGSRAWFFPLLVGLCALIVGCILLARSGRTMKVRRIAGLDAIDEAVGRATEMGRPVLFVAGIEDMDNVQTVAGVTILGRVAKIAAEYDARIEVPTARSLVMTAARDIVQTSYFEAGRHDAYNPDSIRYITDEQFGYVAYVAGRMVREKPATCIYMGQFYAESLLLSETGNSISSIQIAGTAESSQLPFFVAACDYTLIGEEFFAASAYLSREPAQLGSLFGQDLAKLIAVLVIVIGVLLATLGSVGVASSKSASDYLANSILAS